MGDCLTCTRPYRGAKVAIVIALTGQTLLHPDDKRIRLIVIRRLTGVDNQPATVIIPILVVVPIVVGIDVPIAVSAGCHPLVVVVIGLGALDYGCCRLLLLGSALICLLVTLFRDLAFLLYDIRWTINAGSFAGIDFAICFIAPRHAARLIFFLNLFCRRGLFIGCVRNRIGVFCVRFACILVLSKKRRRLDTKACH